MRVSLAGAVTATVAVPGAQSQAGPFAVDDADAAWVPISGIATGTYGVVKLQPDGTASGPFPTTVHPIGAAIDGQGGLWVASGTAGLHNLTRLSADGTRSGAGSASSGILGIVRGGTGVWLLGAQALTRFTP
jgi:hypothetical protein